MSKKGIVINLQQEAFIPVNIGPFEYKLPTSDKQRKKLAKFAEEMQQKQTDLFKKGDEAQKNDDFEQSIKFFDEAVSISKELVDTVLGKGTFDELYEATGEDTQAVLEAFSAVMDEYKKIQDNKKLNKLVQAKKGK
ncbi:hypothetical protein CBF34_07045 [Vagococcus penaei]|uniref:hypothetical protein n=1 Tax=Vagococcus penaei TaxID=633807 RepID=UPI000F884E47|nr:hypothetical protein [Vagococcus penaei]RSU01409.1 hypothetical protein CBF34_07045 [Vagococcus penaei]